MWITQNFIQDKKEREKREKEREKVIIKICYLLWMYQFLN